MPAAAAAAVTSGTADGTAKLRYLDRPLKSLIRKIVSSRNIFNDNNIHKILKIALNTIKMLTLHRNCFNIILSL